MDSPKSPKSPQAPPKRRAARTKGTAESPFMNIATPRDLGARLKVVAAHQGISMLEALEKYLRPAIDREYRKCVAQANSEFHGGSAT